MAVEKVRSVIRTYVPEDDLEGFEIMCADTDDLWNRLDKEKNERVAWPLAVSWATSVLTLARTERALLSNVLPDLIMERDIPKLGELSERKRDAEDLVYSLRGGHVPQPQNIDHDAKFKERREAVELRNLRLNEIGHEANAIRAEVQEPMNAAVGQVSFCLRVLKAFIENRFPVPVATGTMAGYRNIEPDPMKAFADSWVNGMSPENRLAAAKLEKLKAHQLKMRLRPQHDFEKDKQDHIVRVRNRKKESRFKMADLHILSDY